MSKSECGEPGSADASEYPDSEDDHILELAKLVTRELRFLRKLASGRGEPQPAPVDPEEEKFRSIVSWVRAGVFQERVVENQRPQRRS